MADDNTPDELRSVTPTDFEAVDRGFTGTIHEDDESWFADRDDGHYDRKRIETPGEWDQGDFIVELLTSENAGVQINVWKEGESSLHHIWKPATVGGDDYHKAEEFSSIYRTSGCGVYEAVTDASDVVELMGASTPTDMLDVASRAGIEL